MENLRRRFFLAQSIKMHKIATYPDSFPVESEEVNNGVSNVNFKTVVKLLGDSEYEGMSLKKLQIQHEIGTAFMGKGILEDGTIYDIIGTASSEVFPCFVKGEEYLYTSGTRREIAAQALRRLKQFRQNQNHIIANNIKINLTEFKSYLEASREGAIKGGWFRGMQVKNVEVAYLGGGTVTASEDWDKYEASGGTISALRIDLPTIELEDEPIKVLLTHDGNCVVYKNVGEHDLLSIAIPLFNAAEEFIEGK